jgi:hypothetical protein
MKRKAEESWYVHDPEQKTSEVAPSWSKELDAGTNGSSPAAL